MAASWILLSTVALVFASCESSTATRATTTTPKPKIKNCGYKACQSPKEGYINVHIVPHTHDDVGWLKTVDQYYYGSSSNYQKAGVQYILDTVVDSLRKDKNRKFIYVETAFFWKWWIKQHDIIKSRVRKLVNSGQLEFIGGGWSMNDEATTHYQSIIDQMTWGLRKLNESFGECGHPKIGWQIDPFGHSREMASIFAQLGFDGVLLGRIDTDEKGYRMQTKTAEMVWRGSNSLGEASDIFTGVMYNTYSPPPGFCFDILCSDEPIIDDRKSFEYNVDQRVDDFLEYAKNVSSVYATDNIIITMGEDFNYQDAEAWFTNLDKLIYYTNLRQTNGSKFNLFYSTPSCYVKAIHDETNGKKDFLLKQDDFFPYASDRHSFWTGYFTSRPTIKKFEREGNNFLQVCKQLYALTDLGPEDRVDLNVMREAMGTMQHHDAITGTEKQHVAEDYARRLQRGIDDCEIIADAALNKLKTSLARETPKLNFTTCPLVNVSQCAFTETETTFVVTVYNPLSRPVTKFLRLPVTGQAYSVKDPDGNDLVTQIMPIAEPILKIPGRESNAVVELIFMAENIAPLGFKSYFVQNVSGDHKLKPKRLSQTGFKDSAEFTFDESTGLLDGILVNDILLPVDQTFMLYEGYVGDNEKPENRSSGAYIFRPTTNYSQKVSSAVDYQVFTGELVSEIHQTFNEWISQVIRVNARDKYVEFDWLVGPIPTDEPNGKEVITTFQTQIPTEEFFYTDSNAREMLRRKRNFRPTWDVTLEEPVSGNYYPVTSKIAIRNDSTNVEFAVLTDRAQGGSSLLDGQIELMVHRRCLHDDAFGVGEALNETAFGKGLVARGSHYVTVGNISSSEKTIRAIEKDIAQRKLLDSWVFLSSPSGLTYEEYKQNYVTQYSGLKQALPDNVQILTLEPWQGFTFLLRLEHVFEIGEDPLLSKPVTVKLKDLFTAFEITSLWETTLGANEWLKDNERLKFKTNGTMEELISCEYYNFNDNETFTRNLMHETGAYGKMERKREVVIYADDYTEDFEVVLAPMQIRTFIIDIKKH
ncbi:lysosomal alpha-mannosidase-like [Cylas formicarius]|uniref:lysosomal alpha-mannosidase-like n=1 Tax=Cylas formicarius TaxID=197179 RepID=UPI00295877FF|nr:lysosomal alpha-mannosidase-like [Cylas formicarius]XP_060520151.1 lysosomal alpha-mannosidase-like [Cylas formicarius]